MMDQAIPDPGPTEAISVEPGAVLPAEAVAVAADRLGEGAGLDVRPDDAWAEAGRKVLRLHLARMLARVPGVLSGDEPEDVHAMRVATRRLRAAWRVFGDGFERDAARRYRAELRDIGRRLGAVRDLDVLIGILIVDGERRSARYRAGLAPLLGAWHAEREAHRLDLAAALGSERFATFVVDYERLVETPGHAAVAVPPHAPGLVRDRIPAKIWTAYQAVRAFDDDLGTADLATLHRLRIEAKWLRYTLEFVRGPLEPEAGGLIRRMVALQDHLGIQHDQHVAAVLAREFATSTAVTVAQSRSMSRFDAHLEKRVDGLGRTLEATWRPIVAPSYRRALGRAIARL